MVDWSDPETKFMIAQPHRGQQAIVSRDGGKSFQDLNTGALLGAWVFDSRVAVVALEPAKNRSARLLRTTDAGQTFTPCGDYQARGLPRWRDGTLYWVTSNAMILSRDKGETWQETCKLAEPLCGPAFGVNPKHMFVLLGGAVVESSDGGANWSKPERLPPAMGGNPSLTWIDYDPVHDLLYMMRMGSELYQLARAHQP
jgi:photosystem II stability/assembly factor-like uncharacterized protein